MEMNPAVIFRLRDNGKNERTMNMIGIFCVFFQNVERELNRVYIYLLEDGFIY